MKNQGLIYNIHVENQTYIFFKKNLDKIAGSKLDNAIRGITPDDRVLVSKTNGDVYLNVSTLSWMRFIGDILGDYEEDLYEIPTSTTPSSSINKPPPSEEHRLEYISLKGKLGSIIDTDNKDESISSEDKDLYYQESSAQESEDADSSVLLTGDQYKIQKFFKNIQKKLSLDNKDAHKIMNRLSTDENMSKFIQNSVDYKDESDSSVDSLDLDIEYDSSKKHLSNSLYKKD